MKKGTKYLALFIMVLAVLFCIPAMDVSAAGTVRTGTLGTNKGIQWSYDENTKTLTVTGEDSGLGSSTASPFKSICSDVETIIVKDCKLSGSATRLFSGFTYLRTVTFENFDTSNVTSMSYMFSDCRKLNSLDVSGFDTMNVKSMYAMFYGCSGLTDLDVSGFDTSNVTDMRLMFSGCSGLTDLDVSGFDTSNVTSMNSMFNDCKSLTDLDVSGFDTSKVTNMSYMFDDCNVLTDLDVSGFNTSKVTDMSHVFAYCSKLTVLDVSGFDTSNVTNMEYMFCSCKSLTNLDVSGFDTSNVTSMYNMFYFCSVLTDLDVSGFDTSKVTNMRAMFQGDSSLTDLNVSDFDTSNVTNMYFMFYGCSSLTDLDVSGFDTSKVMEMGYMFYGCNSLTDLDVSGFDTSGVTGMTAMFQGCSGLTDLDVSGLDTSKVKFMTAMFQGCSGLTDLDVSGFDTSQVTGMSSMFRGCSSLTDLDLKGFKTPNVTNTEYMFYGCKSLTDLNVSGLDTSKVTNMGYMFSNCSSLTNLDVSGFDTSNVTDMSDMFTNCSSLTDLDVSGFDTSKVTDMNFMFFNCKSLKGLDVSGFDTSNVTDMSYMFNGCSGLTVLDGSGFDTSKVTSVAYMFYDCSSLQVLDISGFDISGVTTLWDMLYGCRRLKFLYTPNAMGEGQELSFPIRLLNAQGEECNEVTLANCNMLLSKAGEKQDIKILADATELFAGDSLQLALEVDNAVKRASVNKYYDWSSTAPGTATVSADGLVTAVGSGTTTIQVMVPGRSDLTAQLTVNVKDKVTLNTAEISDWTVGQEGNLTPYVNGKAVPADSMSWSSSNPKVATCVGGKLVGVGVGTTTISCTKVNGTVATCKVTVFEKLEIMSQPASQRVIEGNNVVFKVTAKGDNLSYQWQFRKSTTGIWTDSGMAGAKTGSITVQGTTARNGYQYRCVITDGLGNKLTSNAATLTVTSKLAITSQPANQSVAEGTNAVFKVTATGSKLSYQWQFRKSTTGAWQDSGMTGAKTVNITVQGTTARNGYQYRCVITDGLGNKVTSNAATLTVTPKLAITGQPANQSVTEGTNAVFKVTATGSKLSYQWQFRKSTTGVWEDSGMTGAKTGSITVQGTTVRNGYQYRCVITDGLGNRLTSNAATLTVTPKLAITSQPANQSVAEGINAVFKVTATGSKLSYQWQFKHAGSTKWEDSGMTGAKTGSITVQGTTARNGYQYRCVITDGLGNKLTSNAATLTVAKKLAITGQPKSQSVTEGGNATFKVTATGSNLSYQWQFKHAGSTKWENSGMTGSKTNSITVQGTSARNGYQYRCVITDGSGNKVTSNAATLTVAKKLAITGQPKSQSVTEGGNATFKVTATGSNLSYQWQFKHAGSTKWENSGMTGATTGSITVQGTAARNGYQYRCIITDENGNEVTSNGATLTVK